MIRRILLPAVLPAYVVALRVGLGLGWMFVVAAEFMGASEGLGYLLIDGQQLGKPAQIVAAIVIFAILGKTTDWLIELATAPLLRWQDAFGRQGGARLMLRSIASARPIPTASTRWSGSPRDITQGEIVAIIGGSGCGKSTLLRAIAGLDRASTGTVTLDDDAITAPHAKIGIIFQEPRLLPWLSVADNIGFGLADLPAAERREKVGAGAGARRSRRQGQGLAARTVRRAGAARRDRARAGAAAGSAAARRAVLRARRLHAARSAGPSARPLGRHAADAGAGHA